MEDNKTNKIYLKNVVHRCILVVMILLNSIGAQTNKNIPMSCTIFN